MKKNIKISLLIFLLILIIGISSCEIKNTKTNKENKNSNQNSPEDYYIKNNDSKDYYIHGAIGIGFKKDVPQQEAEAVLKKYNLTFAKTDNLNLGMRFFYESGEKFAVKTGERKENFWISVLNNESIVYGAFWLPDPDKVLVD
jgi:hypothetical protein